ncbi:MAG TPA: TIGR03067 domain-containing protein [Gemmataceae bacterium]|nr:TIGR03067 domain-containing protein [Gemmataceae bacterium]
MRPQWLLLITAAGLAAGAQEPDPDRRDLDRLQGTWRVVSLVADGKPVPAEAIARARFVFQGKKLMTQEGDKKISEGFVRLDSRRKPATIEISPEWLPERGKTTRGIYAFEGDVLKLVLSPVGEEPPAAFASPIGSGHAFFTLKREGR